MVLLFFGPPGSGKGTQSKLITEWLKVPAISTGELFRAEIASRTALGVAARTIIARGELVGDDIVNRMLEKRLMAPDARGGFLLDGYPRTIPQAEFLDQLLEERGLSGATVLHLEVPRQVIVERLSGRRNCPVCQSIYNVYTQSSRVAGVCDLDGARLEIREDDREEVVRLRLEEYDRVTGPLIGFYSDQDYIRIDGHRDPDEVAQELESALEERLVRVRQRR